MADRAQMMTALRNAHAAGDTDAARRIAGMIQSMPAVDPRPVAEVPKQTALPENPVGSGESATFGERAESAIAAGGAGLMRGAAELVGLPGTISKGIDWSLEKAGILSPDAIKNPATEMLSGSGIRDGLSAITGGRSEYKDPTRVGKFAGTLGEFVGGGGPTKAVAAAALASEAAGQLTEGTAFEPAARFAGAMFAPIASSVASKTIAAASGRSAARPSLETLRDTKNAAYRAVDDAGVTFDRAQTDRLASLARQRAADANFVAEVDNQTRAALSILKSKRGKDLTLGQLDKIRQGLWGRYNAAPNEVGIRAMIDDIDDVIQSSTAGGAAMKAARAANSQYKKAELIDNAFKKAADQTASTGSGGNILNKYRQAVTRIINNPKDARFFSPDEISFMREFVHGKTSENVLRQIGKLSPNGNGLMMALNLGAIAANPAFVLATAAGVGSKALSDRSAMRGAESIRDMVATGKVPRPAASQGVGDFVRPLGGLLAQ